ncbi:hypothetical protein [Parapedobacter soli]|uniref:hypothetical protein n=1 Tax=Parapedobacter soli TaxID=416955 RepID=UPI0021C9C7CB|nr:hypothetical protein [Parapedobacter soli]
MIQKGLKQGIEAEKAAVVANLLLPNKFSIPEITSFAGAAEDSVKKVRVGRILSIAFRGLNQRNEHSCRWWKDRCDIV